MTAEFTETAPEALRLSKENTLYFSGARNHFNEDEAVTLAVIVDVFLDILAIRLRDSRLTESVQKEVVHETPSV